MNGQVKPCRYQQQLSGTRYSAHCCGANTHSPFQHLTITVAGHPIQSYCLTIHPRPYLLPMRFPVAVRLQHPLRTNRFMERITTGILATELQAARQIRPIFLPACRPPLNTSMYSLQPSVKTTAGTHPMIILPFTRIRNLRLIPIRKKPVLLQSFSCRQPPEDLAMTGILATVSMMWAGL